MLVTQISNNDNIKYIYLPLPPEWPRWHQCGWRWPWTDFGGRGGRAARIASSPSRSFPAFIEVAEI